MHIPYFINHILARGHLLKMKKLTKLHVFGKKGYIYSINDNYYVVISTNGSI